MPHQHRPEPDNTSLPATKGIARRLWFSPVMLLVTFLLVFWLIIWLNEGNNRRTRLNDLHARTKTFSGTLQLMLEGNANYLAMLAFERSSGKLDARLFQQRASEYVETHPELINITWVDAEFVIRDVAPLAPSRQIVGLQLNLPEPNRVSRLARDLRQPVYTRPFQAIQGQASFEIWVPVYRNDTFLGLFGGVYSCEKLLEQLISKTSPRLYYVSLLDREGRLLAGFPLQAPLDPKLSQEVVLTSEESGVVLRVNRYEEVSDWRISLLKVVSLMLVLGTTYALWKLRREVEERKRVEAKLSQQAGKLEREIMERQSVQEHLQEQAAILEEEITERGQAEEALRGSEEKLRLLLDSTGEGIYGMDIEGNCTFCNLACLRMIGLDDAAPLLGQDMHSQIHHSYPDGSPMPKDACIVHRTLLEKKGSHVDSEVFWRKDGSSFPVEYWSHPQIKNGQVVGAVVAFIDITDRKRLEEQFRQAQKMESVGRLAGGVAHDFNNMLSVILGAAELCRRRVDEGETIIPYLELITNAAARSSEITRQLLAFSRKEVISPRPVDLNLLIVESNKILVRLINEDIKLTFRPADRLWVIMIDPSQVDQILMNLAVNARDAMPGGGALTIETANVSLTKDYAYLHPSAKPGQYVQLTVADTGFGMDKQTVEHIFEPFFTTKEVGKGTGLGLATVYGIVTQNNGFINVYSEPGQGTVFRIYLPRLAQPVESAELPPPSAPALSGTVLLVEDEEMLLWLATKLLEELGLNVIQAQSPAHAIEICLDPGQNIDMILTDVVMPEMNGRDMVERIRQIRPELKVLFMSGHTSDNVLQRGIVERGMHYIQKPLELQKLGEKIRQVLAAR